MKELLLIALGIISGRLKNSDIYENDWKQMCNETGEYFELTWCDEDELKIVAEKYICSLILK